MSDEVEKDEVRSADQPAPDGEKTRELSDEDLARVSGGMQEIVIKKNVDKASSNLNESS